MGGFICNGLDSSDDIEFDIDYEILQEILIKPNILSINSERETFKSYEIKENYEEK